MSTYDLLHAFPPLSSPLLPGRTQGPVCRVVFLGRCGHRTRSGIDRRAPESGSDASVDADSTQGRPGKARRMPSWQQGPSRPEPGAVPAATGRSTSGLDGCPGDAGWVGKAASLLIHGQIADHGRKSWKQRACRTFPPPALAWASPTQASASGPGGLVTSQGLMHMPPPARRRALARLDCSSISGAAIAIDFCVLPFAPCALQPSPVAAPLSDQTRCSPHS